MGQRLRILSVSIIHIGYPGLYRWRICKIRRSIADKNMNSMHFSKLLMETFSRDCQILLDFHIGEDMPPKYILSEILICNYGLHTSIISFCLATIIIFCGEPS